MHRSTYLSLKVVLLALGIGGCNADDQRNAVAAENTSSSDEEKVRAIVPGGPGQDAADAGTTVRENNSTSDNCAQMALGGGEWVDPKTLDERWQNSAVRTIEAPSINIQKRDDIYLITQGRYEYAAQCQGGSRLVFDAGMGSRTITYVSGEGYVLYMGQKFVRPGRP
jgi:hypothetical protein